MGKTFLIILILLITVLGAVWFLGPKAQIPQLDTDLPTFDVSLMELEAQINDREASQAHIKPDNEARIIWADGYMHKKSPYSLVYLHGFSASQGEGEPVHRDFAKKYGCNLYLARLQSHGLEEEEPLLDLDPEKLLQSAKEAIAIGKQIGEKTLVMSTSTGGTLGIYLASGNPDIAGLICFAPNVDIKDPSSELLVKPWGLQMARWVVGSNYRTYESSEDEQRYWNTRYRLESLVALKALVKATMKEEVFQKVTSPLLLVYYYKSDTEQDDVVSIPRMLEMYNQLGTPEAKKQKVPLPDVGTHPLASKYTSKDIQSVEEATFAFAEGILGLSPIEQPTDSLVVE